MISLYTLQRLRTFPHKTRSPPFVFSHYMVFEKRMTETQSFRSASTLRPGRPYHLHPLHLLVYHCKSLHDLLSYARAHNSMWLHTEVSSMNNLMIPLSLGGGPKTNRQSWNTQVPQSTQMCIKVATLNKPLIINLTSVMDIHSPNPRLPAQHGIISKRRSNSQGFAYYAMLCQQTWIG